MIVREDLRAYGNWAGRIIIAPRHNLIFVKNAKVATSTTILWLHRLHTGDYDWRPEINVHREHKLPHPSTLGWPNIITMLAGDAVRFSFVRHPVRRIESAYVDKIASPDKRVPGTADLQIVHAIQRTLGLPEDPDGEISPAQFVAALEAQDPLSMDPHWRPQHLNLMHPVVSYDVLGRLECYATDLARVADLVGARDVPVEARNASTGPRGVFAGSLLRRVEALYARDFELYGY